MNSPKTDSLSEGFEAAVKLSDDGRHQEAAELLESLLENRVDRRSKLAAVHAKLGNIYLSRMSLSELAEPHFRKACELSPSSELASLGLFHSLMQQGKIPDALTEMRRFLAQRPSEEYKRLLAEMGERPDE
jgi:tetratricopeptide (TPR) repeat protein